MSQLPQALSSYIFNLLKPYKKWVLSFFLTGLVWASLNTLQPYLLKIVIDKVLTTQPLTLKSLLPYFGLYSIGWLALCSSMRTTDWLKMRFFPKLRQDIMVGAFAQLNSHSYEYFQNNLAGTLSNKISELQQGVIDILVTIDDLSSQILGIVIIPVITLSFYSPLFSLILLCWECVFIAITFSFKRSIQETSESFAQKRGHLAGLMVDSISNHATVRVFSRQSYEQNIIEKNSLLAEKENQRFQRTLLMMRCAWDASTVGYFSLNLLLLLSGYASGDFTVGDISFVMGLSVSIMWNLWYLASFAVQAAEHLGSCQQALDVLNQHQTVQDAPNAQPLIVNNGTIEFKNVSFRYHEHAELFNNKNMLIEAGKKIGLVGFSGSGKSSFVHLLLRLFDVQSGAIFIDNQDIKMVTQKSLREQIAFIPQDPTLFHRSLFENIHYGDLTASEDEVIQAAKDACCDAFIKEIPEGYKTLVGERGIKLSGGQRQRIAIARAFLKKAKILILDEATSALDSITEKSIQDVLRGLMRNKTTIVIAHRLSTLSMLDKIYVFDKGILLEEGHHEHLLALGGHYARLWSMQVGGLLPEHLSTTV